MALALVTGASAGIGAEFVRQLTERGDDVILVARRTEPMEQLATEVSTRHGVRAHVVGADLLTSDGLAAVADLLADDSVTVDLLVNNAGFGTYGRFIEADGERLRRMVRLNVEALVELAHAAGVAMAARGRGGILNVASTAGFQPDPNGAVYGATKAFVRSFSHALHSELKATGVTVTALSPGVTSTEFQETAELDPSGVTASLAMDVRPVVAAGLRALDRGRAEVVPGMANKLTAPLSQRLPTALSRALSGRLHAMWVSNH